MSLVSAVLPAAVQRPQSQFLDVLNQADFWVTGVRVGVKVRGVGVEWLDWLSLQFKYICFD